MIYIESLCAKFGLRDFKELISQVTAIINFIRGRALLHREFTTFLENIDSDYHDVLYYTDVRWLSAGKMAERFYLLIPQIREFLRDKNYATKFPEIYTDEWVLKTSFSMRHNKFIK